VFARKDMSAAPWDFAAFEAGNVLDHNHGSGAVALQCPEGCANAS
jgi:hypothetical protein